MNENNVRLQNLRDFTVQIRNADDQIVGTGIAVSTDGKIVTCAHVVQAALGAHPRNANGAEVGVYFPQVRGGEEKKRKAVVEKFFPDNDDDVVLLQLTSGASPLAPEQIAIVGRADESATHAFRSYGYRVLKSADIYTPPQVGGWADGIIMGSVDSPEGLKLQIEPVQLDSKQIAQGMSGSGVLDVERNLVVGIVSDTYYPSVGDPKDRDTAYAVNASVLSLEPVQLYLQAESQPLQPAPSPKTDIAQAEAAVFIKDKYSWNSAPSVLNEWTGRDDLLKQITDDWNDLKKHVVGLIGFGGEGKSSLARKWVETLNLQPANLPTGIFWWGFYENRSVDEFLEAALKYMSGGRIDPRQVQSSNLRAQIIGAMLGAGRYLFVLDGLEVMQHQDGDQYGLLQSNDLRDLLTFFARPDNQSFCLVTSRAPLLDLMDYTTYTHRDVDRLSEEDGRILLRRLGVKGNDNELNKVVADWDGHALTLSILAAYLAERFNGDIHHLADIPIPTADEQRYERVHRVLHRYDEHLTQEERGFLKLFSVFRLPVWESAFEKVFEPLLGVRATQQGKPDSVLSKLFKRKRRPMTPLQSIVNHLVNYRLIRHDEHENSYTTHPLIRNYYFALFTKGDPSQEKAAHEQIKEYYISIAGDMPRFPTLDDLKPLIEVVHHACQAGAYDEARDIYWNRIDQSGRGGLTWILGAYDTELTLMQEFFLDQDISKEPKTSNADFNRYILNVVGWCFKNLGRLREAIPVFERKNELYEKTSGGYQNLADLYAELGALEASTEAAHHALDLARKAENKKEERNSLLWQAWVAYFQNDQSVAKSSFAAAEKLELERDKSVQYLTRTGGTRHAVFLYRTGQTENSRKITNANIKYCERNRWFFIVSSCHCILGDLDFNSGNPESARAHYESALKIARSISKRDVLIEALLARGRFHAKHTKDANAAFNDLNEALGYCVESGYRIYETDVRVALAWAYLAISDEQLVVSNKQKAKAEAERALQMSNEMGYHWGKVDAKEVLERIEE